MKFVSGVFHPLLQLSYLLSIFYFYQPAFFSPVSQGQIPKLLMAAFTTSFLIPVLSIMTMKLTSRVSTFSLSNREERILPFITILMFYGSTAYLFIHRIGIHLPISAIMIALSLLIALLLIITFWEKISIHSAASWSLSGAIVAISINYTGTEMLIPLLISIVIAGTVTSSRIYLKKHTPNEAWSGTIIGFFFALFSLIIFS